jgi:hypothetical protein
MPVPVAVPRWWMAAPPISAMRPEQELTVGGLERDGASGKQDQQYRTD